MKNLLGIVLIFGLILFFGCQEEDDCPGCNLNPKVKLKFEAIAVKKSIEGEFLIVKEKMKTYRDSLKNTANSEVISSLTDKIDILRSDSLKLDEKYNQLRVGKIQIDEITAQGPASIELFQDTLIRDFALPIDMQNDTSTFYFNYYGLSDTLQVYYQRDIIQNLEGMRMKINAIKVNKELSTFDSVRVKCYKSDCSNDLTTIYVYF